MMTSSIVLFLLLSCAGKQSSAFQSAPPPLSSTALHRRSSLQQQPPTWAWVNDTCNQRIIRTSSRFLASQQQQEQANNDDEATSPPLLRKRDRIRLLVIKPLTNFILRLQSRLGLDKTKTMWLSLLLSWFIGSVIMDYSGLQIVRSSRPRVANIETVAFSQFMNYCEQKQNGGPRHVSVIEKVKVDTAAQKLEYSILNKDDKSDDDGSQVAQTVRKVAQTDYSLMDKSDLIQYLRRNHVDFEAASVTNNHDSATSSSATQKSIDGMTTLAVLFGAYKLFYNQSSSSSSLSMLSSKDAVGKLAKKKKSSSSSLDVASSSTTTKTTFDDIYGIDNAKHDVMELIDSLRHPEQYRLVGARPPRGILLEGPPGCGKTSLARACANVANVPLIYCSGSDFVETYVGKGAARVRQLFAQARSVAKGSSSSSCLVFVDEIDAIGKARRGGGGSGVGNGSSDEAEQTLNALLTQMDGLGDGDDDDAGGIFVLAATNRRELLDPALVRSGRFDRLIKVDLPNIHGRYEILRSHAMKLPGFVEGNGVDANRPNSLGVGKSIDLNAVAAVTEGCSGADLEQIVNEAAIRTVRRVSVQLKDGVPTTEVDVSILPEDIEESINSFFQARSEKKRSGSARSEDGLLFGRQNSSITLPKL